MGQKVNKPSQSHLDGRNRMKLTLEQQHTLFAKLQNYLSQDRQPLPQHIKDYNRIRNEILENNLGLVKSIAINYNRNAVFKSLSVDDLFSAGVLGLMEAIRKFEPLRNILFSTFATYDIKQAMQTEFYRRAIIYIPKRIKNLSTKHRRYMATNNCSLEKAFTDLETKSSDRERITCCLLHNITPLTSQSGEDNSDTDIEYKDRGHDYYLNTDDKLCEVLKLFDDLKYNERTCLELRLDGETLEQVGKHLFVTKARAQQIEKTAQAKLRQKLQVA